MTIELTDTQAQTLVALLDVAVKAGGLQLVDPVKEILDVLKNGNCGDTTND